MTTTNEELGRRAVACKHWRWMPGMLGGGWEGRPTVRIGTVDDDDGEPCIYILNGDILRDCDGTWGDDGDGLIPDFDDPATLGCLLALVREAWSEPTTYAAKMRANYFAVGYLAGNHSEAEALVAALASAP